MPDPTTAALLALWERCGDLRPDTLAVAASKSSDELTLCLCIRAAQRDARRKKGAKRP